MSNRYNSIVDTKGRYNAVSPEETAVVKPVKKVVTPQPAPIAPTPKPIQAPREQTMAEKYGLPESTISQAKPQVQEKPSIWNRVAKTLLPKRAEDYFGLNDSQIQKDIKTSEDAKQYEFAGGRSITSGLIDSLTDWDSKDVPFYGSGKEAVESVGLAQSARRFEKGEQKPGDVSKLQEYYKNNEKEAKLQRNTGYAAGETIKNSVRFMGELLPVALSEILTGSVAPTGDAWVLAQASKIGVKETLKKYAEDKAFRTALTTAVKNKAKVEAATVAKQFGLTAPTNITDKSAERMIGQYDFETGKIIEPGQPIGEAIVNGVSQHAVELLSERTGGITGKLIGKMATPVKNVAVKSSIYNALKKRLPSASNSQLTALLKKSGWNGVIGEFFEERDADALNQLLFSVGLGDQEFQGLTIEQIATELIAFSVMGGGISAGVGVYNKTADKIANKQVTKKNIQGEENAITQEPSKESGVFYSGAKGHVVETSLNIDKAKVATIKGDQRGLTNSSSYVEADQKLFDKYSSDYDFVKIEHPEMSNKADEYYNLKERKWYSQDKDVAEVYAMQKREGKYEIKKEIPTNTGPGYQDLSRSIDKMVESGTFYPEEATILKTLFEGTNDKLLSQIKYTENSRFSRTLGRFRTRQKKSTGEIVPGSPDIQMQTGLAKKDYTQSSRTFVHEFGHAGWHLILTQEERNLVTKVFNETSKAKRTQLFSNLGGNVNYYAENEHEFFAQAFSDYVFENKVPAPQMKALFKRITGELWRRLKNLVTRGEVKAVKTMSPVFEKILAGDTSTPLTEFYKKEPPSFKKKLQEIFDDLAPEAKRLQGAQSQTVVPGKSLFSGGMPELEKTAEGLRDLKNNIENISDKKLEVLYDFTANFAKGNDHMENTPEYAEMIKRGYKPIDPNNLRRGFDMKKETTPEPTPEQPVQDVFDSPVGNSPMETVADTFKTTTESLPPDIASTIEPIEKVMTEDGTPLAQQVGALDYIRTPWRVFEKMGLRPAYQKLLAGYEAYMKELPTNIDKITAWSKRVSKESNERIFEYLDGESIELNTNEAQVANEIKAWMAQWADRLGMSPDARITDYITHIFPKGKGGEIPEEIAYMIRGKIPGSVYNPFLLERLGAEGYIKDTWRALDAYTKRATRKVNMDPGLAEIKEASDKLTHDTQIDYINNYVSKINLRPNRIDKMIDTSIKQLVGYKFGARPTAEITRSLRMMIARAKIGFSAISFAKNITQGVNTLAELSAKYTTIGYIDLVKYGGKELEAEGVLIAPFIEDRKYSAVKGAIEKVDKVLFVNMNASELVNRGAAYYGAKAKFVAGKIKPHEYKKAFGKEMPKDYNPTMKDAIDYGKFVAAKTQFKFGALDTPVAMNSDLMKLIFQFQTFSLKQAEFITQMAKDKEYAKLVRYTTASTMLFQIIGSAFGMSWEDAIKPWRFGLPPALQFFLDLFEKGIVGKDKYGNILDTEEKVKATADTLLTNVVPGGVQAKRTFEGLGVVNEGAARTKSGNFKHKVEQTPSNYVRGSLFGKYNLPESKAYYKKKDDKAKGKSNSSRSNRYNGL